MKRSTTTAGAVLTGALLISGGGIAASNAADDGANEPSAPSQSERAHKHEAVQAEFTEKLADELGVSEDEVSSALENVREEMREDRQAEHTDRLKQRLDDAVANGSLTQEQADAIVEAAKSGALDRERGPGGQRGPGGPMDGPVGDAA